MTENIYKSYVIGLFCLRNGWSGLLYGLILPYNNLFRILLFSYPVIFVSCYFRILLFSHLVVYKILLSLYLSYSCPIIKMSCLLYFSIILKFWVLVSVTFRLWVFYSYILFPSNYMICVLFLKYSKTIQFICSRNRWFRRVGTNVRRPRRKPQKETANRHRAFDKFSCDRVL